MSNPNVPSADAGGNVVSLFEARCARAFGCDREPRDVAAEILELARELNAEVQQARHFDNAALERIFPPLYAARHLCDLLETLVSP